MSLRWWSRSMLSGKGLWLCYGVLCTIKCGSMTLREIYMTSIHVGATCTVYYVCIILYLHGTNTHPHTHTENIANASWRQPAAMATLLWWPSGLARSAVAALVAVQADSQTGRAGQETAQPVPPKMTSAEHSQNWQPCRWTRRFKAALKPSSSVLRSYI